MHSQTSRYKTIAISRLLFKQYDFKRNTKTYFFHIFSINLHVLHISIYVFLGPLTIYGINILLFLSTPLQRQRDRDTGLFQKYP